MRTIEEKIDIVKRVIRDMKMKEHTPLDSSGLITYGFNSACDAILKVIEDNLEDYPMGRNDYQE